MIWNLRFPRLAATALIGLALSGTRCGHERPDSNTPTLAEMDTSDHDLPKEGGQPLADPETMNEDQQTQNRQDPHSPTLTESPCKTLYPILLVHGVALRDTVLGINYFGRIPTYLRLKCNVDVYQGGQDAFSIMTVSADQLKERILYLTDTLGYKKVNVIAHSKGGLDIRMMFHQNKGQMIYGRTMNERVASFTTLSTPHRGAILVEYLLDRLSHTSEQVIAMVLNIFGFLQNDGDESDAREALVSLSPESMATANALMGDLETGVPNVYCQSWSANISGYIQDSALWTTSKMISSTGSTVNDGAVEESSAKYGSYRGVLGSGLFGGVSHFAVVDRAAGILPGITPGFHVLTFYGDMLAELKAQGF